MNTKGNYTEHVSDDSSPPGSQRKGLRSRGRAGHHCGRFWWIYLIVLCVVVLVIVLPM